MTAPTDAFEAGIRIARALADHAVPYALGGALAYGQYGIPRATNDVDVNVFVDPDQLGEVFKALGTLGIVIDEDAARAASAAEGLIVLRYGLFRLDVFTPSIDFSWEAGRTRVQHVVDDARIWFLSVEALCVFKLLFFRSKDQVDLERLIAVQRTGIDAAYVRAQIVAMMGPEDPRVGCWDALWRDHGGA